MSFRRIRPGYTQPPVMQMRALTDEQCETIIEAAAGLLEKTGVEVLHQEIREMLGKAGCSVEGTRVRVPREVLKRALESIPSEIRLYNRDGEEALLLGGYHTYYGPGLCNTLMVDLETGERRPTVKEDAREIAILCDALPNIDFVYGLVGITDCLPELQEIYELHSLLQYTSKPLAGWNSTRAGCQEVFDMCAAVAGGAEKLREKPFIFMYAGNPVAPFVHPEEYLDKLKFWIERGIPVVYPTGTQPGVNGPVTLAGTLTIAMVDNLAGIVISQVIRPGAPYMGNTIGVPMDMRTMHACYGAPELCLTQMAQADLMHYLAIPTWAIGGASDAKVLDEQAAMETALTLVYNQVAGGNAVHDLGFLEGGLVGSKELLVLSDEIIAYLRRIARGIEINEDTLAVDLIAELGPSASYLAEEHTVEYFREEIVMSDLLDHNRYIAWEQEGGKTMGRRLNERAREILQTHHPKPLPAETVQALDEILLRARRRAGEVQ